MAVTTKISYKGCEVGAPTLGGCAIDPFSVLTSGTTYTSTGKCFEILSVEAYGTLSPDTITFDTGPFTDCRECYGSIFDYAAAVDCINGSTYYFEFTGFTGTPLIDEVYFIEISGKDGSSYNCFGMKSYGSFDPLDPVSYTTIEGTPTLSTDCTGCLNSSFLIYDVTPC